jgi:lysophospholipase L1-like esterase
MKLALSVSVLLLSLAPSCGAEFAIRDGETVVFLGDSITAARAYGKIIENYTLLRFPDRKARFINAGRGGDTAAGGLERLESDVFRRGATLLTVAYGINDIGWGTKADDEHRKKYLDAIRGIVEQCKKRGVRVYICSAAVTGADPNKSEEDFLQKMCDEGMAIARAQGEGTIDVQGTMRGIQKKLWAVNAAALDAKKKETLHAADGIHLNDLGQLAMAFAILKGLGAPADVSAATLDANGPRLIEAKGCKVTELKARDGGLEFVRLDEGLPINFGLFGSLSFRFVPIPEELNRYMLGVKNLPKGAYEVKADDRLLGRFTSEQLAAGLNISSATADAWQPGGPWDAQATILKSLTDARNEVALSHMFTEIYMPEHPNRPKLHEQADVINLRIERLQRAAANPFPYRFVIQPAKEKGAGNSR